MQGLFVEEINNIQKMDHNPILKNNKVIRMYYEKPISILF
ncbi:15169_t:CDS:2 [Entrophospora sp. SA101]|nr:15169_t:CDS:2 [Entrophospora sp. SA101]